MRCMPPLHAGVLCSGCYVPDHGQGVPYAMCCRCLVLMHCSALLLSATGSALACRAGAPSLTLPLSEEAVFVVASPDGRRCGALISGFKKGRASKPHCALCTASECRFRNWRTSSSLRRRRARGPSSRHPVKGHQQ
jgi:hypothetical protein